jgi:hypothetical protein
MDIALWDFAEFSRMIRLLALRMALASVRRSFVEDFFERRTISDVNFGSPSILLTAVS